MKTHVTNNSITRRQWFADVARATAVLLTARATANAGAEDNQPWIDAHSHIWTRNVQKFPLAEGATLDDLQPPSFTAEELLDVAHRHGVGRVVLIQHHTFHGWDNSYLVDAARHYPCLDTNVKSRSL